MKNLSIEDRKKIVYEIINGNLKKYNINIYPVTYQEYFNELSEDVKLNLHDRVIYNLHGYTHNENVVIFIDNAKYYSDSLAWGIFHLISSTYHEAKHVIQKKMNSYSYDGFIREVDRAVQIIDKDDYFSNYYSSFCEIEADIYGTQNAKQYMQQKYPVLYKKIHRKIDKQEVKQNYDYIMYDTMYIVNRFIKLIKSNVEFTDKNPIKEVCPALDIFLNENREFKILNEIIENNKFKELDSKIVYSVLSSDSFFESINIEELSNEELEMILNALKYKHKTYQKQSMFVEESLSKKVIDKRIYYYDQRNILNQLKTISEKEKLIMLQIEKKHKIVR